VRVAVLASGFVDYSAGLAEALAKSGPVLLAVDDAALAREREAAPAGVERFGWRQDRLWRRWSGVVQLSHRLARWRPDLVVAHEHAHPHLTRLVQALARRTRLALVVHDPAPHPGRDADFALRRREEIAAQRRCAHLLLAHGPGCAAQLSALTGRAVLDVPHGPVLAPGRPLQPPPGRGRLLLFGRMERYKGLDVLLEALGRPELSSRPPTLEVRGDGPELKRLEPALARAPRTSVHPGWAAAAELMAALAGCDLVVAPYLQASGSGVAAAAAANGRGLVASAVGGLADVVRPGVNGLLTPPGDPAALARALAAAMPRAEAFGRAAQALAAESANWGIVAHRLRAAAQALPARAG
jgi:glycosyltransferase involved in cell wall biosynthesis